MLTQDVEVRYIDSAVNLVGLERRPCRETSKCSSSLWRHSSARISEVNAPTHANLETTSGLSSVRVEKSCSSNFGSCCLEMPGSSCTTSSRTPRARVRPHAVPCKGPWPLQRSRGDGNGGRFVRSLCLLSWRGLRLFRSTPDVVLWSLYSHSQRSCRPQPRRTVPAALHGIEASLLASDSLRKLRSSIHKVIWPRRQQLA